MLKKNIVIIIFLSLSLSSFAQFEKELFGIDYVRLGDGNSVNSVKFQKLSIRLTIPKRLNEKGSILINKFEFAKTNINYSSDLSILADLEKFQTISYSLGYRQSLKNDWSLIGMLTPIISTNSKSSINWDDINLRGMLLFSKSVRSNLRLNLGAMYDATTGIPLPLPVFSLVWNPSQKWQVNFGFPQFGIKYQLGPTTTLGADLYMVGDNFTLTKDLSYIDEKIDNIRIMNIGGGLSLTQKLTKHLKLNVKSGYTFYRKFEFRDDEDAVLDFNLDNDLYLKAGISFGF